MQIPAIGMMIAGALDWLLFCLAFLVTAVPAGWPVLAEESPSPIPSARPFAWLRLLFATLILPGVILGPLLLLGGYKMLRLRSNGLAVTAGVIALLSCQAAFFGGMAFRHLGPGCAQP